tara:strand:+ start:469 stop:1320 length:852 start_codon:yes stop_codon:yes gene_type:complete
MKGIILSGGDGKRLYPITKSITKQLLPIYDKPMIYYPLSTLMEFQIRDILIIVKPSDLKLFKNLLGNGSKFGIKINYKIQKKPAGIAESFLIGEKFINKSNVCLILGDNIFHGIPYREILPQNSNFNGAKIILYKVQDPDRYGVAKFNKKNKIIKIVEKPKKFISNYAVTGIYFYDNKVINFAKKLKPSNRNELEITDINNYYLKESNLKYFKIKPGGVWLDAGTEKSLLQSSLFIQTMQERQNIQISSPEIIAYNNGWISKKKLISSVSDINNSYTSFIKNS